ncbi:MAG TPA: LytTR family DNA-binding domain-containing protein [Flavisolibacter sp.]|nr:LytTR family DNA-binding domain-containing protein [Flavisolibacter sp.]
MRCLIVDDEPLAINLLKGYLSKVPGLVLVKATTDVFDALKTAQNEDIDLVFLDIQMPELTGIQFMKILAGKCKVILTTAYQDYALQGYEFDVVDYLLKPFSLERFMIAVNKAKSRMEPNAVQATATPNDFIFVKSEYRMVRIELKEVLYLESLRDYVAIHTATGKILTLQSLRSFEEQLGSAFLRVHKSYIVAIDKIKAIERRRLLIGNAYIPIGETYQDAFWSRIPAPKNESQ